MTGFGVPVRVWLLGPLRRGFERLVLRPHLAVYEWIVAEAARAEFRVLEAGGVRADRLWALLDFGLWMAASVRHDAGAAELVRAG
jgi:hypothetical protein